MIYQTYIKRGLDIIVSAIGLVLLSPIYIIIAYVVKKKLGSPVFFRQERVGKKNKIFSIIKFRTMTDERDAEGHLLCDEKRLTTFGIFLRNTSLDEIPELINILKGDMSLIGPRPLPKRYLPYYSKEQQRRHLIRPGLTGLAQINGRNNCDWDKRFEYDIYYVDHISFKFDLSIFFQTIFKVLKREGINENNQTTKSAFKGIKGE